MKLIKLYSDEELFREVNFREGINLICGEKSINPDGTISSNKENGVGKSLAIELINFCLLKKQNESRIPQIKDDYLPKEAFVNLHFQINGKDYVFSRNKKGKIRIKDNSGEFQEYSFDDAKALLNKILGFSDKDISAREYLSFAIKEEDYSYKTFGELYKANYSDLLRIHFYFFNLPVNLLGDIKQSFEDYSLAQATIRKINQELASKDLDIDKLRAVQNQIESEIKGIESNFNYPNAISNIEHGNLSINEIENQLNTLLIEKKQQELALLEITNINSFFGNDFYINNDDVKLIYNKFKTGLGDYIKKDLDELWKFRNQVIEFKNDFLKEKKESIERKIYELQSQIVIKQKQISEYYKDILNTSSNNMVKNFRIFRDKYSRLDDNSANIKQFDKQEKIKDESKNKFSEFIKTINKRKTELTNEEVSFKETFTAIHNAIMGSSECDFGFDAKNIFKAKSFFKFKIYIQGQGSKGINQMQSVIYDLALMSNTYTKLNNLGFVIHDNLIFGSVDKDSSIRTLNYLNSINSKSYQYIATVNKDDFNYQELKNDFSFNPTESVVIELTRQNPLFSNWKS